MTKATKTKRNEWRKLRRPPLSTDREYPFCVMRNGIVIDRWPRHWAIGYEHRIHNPASHSGFTYFFPGSFSHRAGDYDALMLAGCRVDRKIVKWKF